jgi:short subunit dehydrogenase-like uncharacterized protein
MSDPEREFDVILWGATGFTGRLVAEYLLQRHGADDDLRWALGGRNPEKLESIRTGLGTSAASLPIILGDGDDEASLSSLARRARVVCTSVGPYAIYGSKLVAACAAHGTDYCDLTGEVHWMRRMIDAHQKEAEATGARIVHTCGFDSIPSDLGVHFVQSQMRERHGVSSPHVKGRAAEFSGGFSGGTVASMLNMLEEAGRDPAVRRVMSDPYGLNPEGERAGADEADRITPTWDDDFDQWTGPFVMAAINTRVVRRSQALLGHPHGREFRYDETLLTGPPPAGFLKAGAVTAGMAAVAGMGSIPALRRMLGRFLPEPGEGPSQEQREKGFWDMRFHAAHPDDPAKNVRARLTGDRDPGYGSTAKMLGEAAVCLAKDNLREGGGFSTPAASMGDALVTRLRDHAGVSFSVDEG